ncbi:MAG: RNA polymerase sigma factor [Myxococcaceae bacterium]
MHIAGETDDGRRVRRALASISAEQRTAVEWAYWDGLSPTEIGERTDLPVESVNKRLELALLKLGDLLSRD